MLGLVIIWTGLQLVKGQLYNGVIEQPFVSCAPDAIYAKWKTEQTFTGRVNVRFAPNRFCYQVLVTNNQVELLIPHLDCKISRVRSAAPEGVLLEATVLLSFHPEFVTEADRLFVVRCLHTRNGSEMGAGVPQPLTMSTPMTTVEENAEASSAAGPTLACSYRVLHERSAELVRTVRIGTPVRHEWECAGARPDQCLVVSNCFIKTVDSQHQLVDAFGCSKDLSLVGQLDYEQPAKVVQRSRVFGVADKPFVYYQCEMNLVDIRPNETCPKPKCSGGTRKTRSPSYFDAVSQQIEVLPLGVPERWPEQKCPQTLNLSVTEYNEAYPLESDAHFCLAVPVFFLGGLALSFMLLLVGSAMGMLYSRRSKYHDVAQA